MRGALVVHPTFEAASSSMHTFFDTLQANPPQRPGAPPAGAAGTADDQLAAAAAAAVAAAKAAQAAAAADLPPPQAGQGQGAVPGGRIITQVWQLLAAAV